MSAFNTKCYQTNPRAERDLGPGSLIWLALTLLSETVGYERQAAPVPDLPPGWKVQKTSDLPAPEYRDVGFAGGRGEDGGMGVGGLPTSLFFLFFRGEVAERFIITWHQRGERGLTLSVLWPRSGLSRLP